MLGLIGADVVSMQEGHTMIAQVLLGLLADLVFEAASVRGRTYEATLDRYLARRGFPSGRRPATNLRTR
jgi:hypothetical protein